MMQPGFQPSLLLYYLQQPWLVWNLHGKLEIGGLALAYLTIVTSWVGYHISIRNNPINVENRYGMLRFIFDIILLAFYWLLLIDFQSLTLQLLLLAAIFAVFIVWDQLKALEYRFDGDLQGQRRRGVTTLWFIAFSLIYAVYALPFFAWFPTSSIGERNFAFLLIATICVLLYRFHKKRLHPERVLDWLSFHRSGFYIPPMRVYIAGPYTSSDPLQVESNVEKAIDAGVEVYRRGHFPFIPHLTHFVDLQTKKEGNPLKWEDYIKWDESWLDKADAFLYLGKSPGADLELSRARRQRKKVFTSLEDIPHAGREKRG